MRKCTGKHCWANESKKYREKNHQDMSYLMGTFINMCPSCSALIPWPSLQVPATTSIRWTLWWNFKGRRRLETWFFPSTCRFHHWDNHLYVEFPAYEAVEKVDGYLGSSFCKWVVYEQIDHLTMSTITHPNSGPPCGSKGLHLLTPHSMWGQPRDYAVCSLLGHSARLH